MIRIEGISQLRINVKPAARVDSLDWRRIGKELDQQGNAIIEQLLSPEECLTIAGLYPNDEIFRSRVIMGRHGFGRGEYKYFSYPLPDLLSELRTAVYSHLVPVANHWNEAMGIDLRYPEKHAFPLYAPAVARQCAIVAYHAMAGDCHCQRVGAAGLGDRAYRIRRADELCNVRVACGRARGNFPKRLPDALLKGGSADVKRKIEAECRRFDKPD
ncbi:MAG TPA: 2OG-Fe(II) oxygenase, partial [Candidatus Acidoferrum sp.]|nr:2OG-Fe(II) oxygenase [Candidatus Acidoferrum sp.]